MSADTVFNKLRKKVNLATVHRALGSFEAAGIIKQVDLHKNAVFYELADAHHHHIVCSVCGRTEEIEGCTIDSLLKKMLHKCSTFAYVKGHSLELFGICRKCM